MSLVRVTFPTGWDQMMQTWETAPYVGMILTSAWTPDPSTDVVVADVVAHEITGPGYLRQTLGTKTRTPILPPDADGIGYVLFDCANPDFGTPSGDAVGAWFAYYADITTDADSPLVGAFQINVTFDGFTAVIPSVGVNGIMRDATACPNDFS